MLVIMYLSYSLAQSCFSHKGHNIIHVDILKQVAWTIYLEKLLSDESESSIFYENIRVQGVWHVKHCGCCSCLSINEGVSLVWPICNQDIMTCFRQAGLNSLKVGFFWKSLLWMLFQHCCQFVWRNLLILGFRSVYGILNLSGVRSKADLEVESTLSTFPLTPMRLEIQHIRISLQFDIESSLFNSLMIRGLVACLGLWHINLHRLFNAKSIFI